MADRKLVVEIVGDDSSLQKSLNRSSEAVKKFAKKTTTTGTSTTGPGSAGRPGSPLGDLLGDVRAQSERADELIRKEREFATEHEKVRRRLEKAAKVGGGFFALGRGIEGAGAALEVMGGHATDSSAALGDAGGAIQDLITLDPAGFFQKVGASAKRTAKRFDDYASSLQDANDTSDSLEAAAAARALGFKKQADEIVKQVARLKTAAATTAALEFAGRAQNVALVNGQTALVNFRGAGASEDVRGGLRGAGGVAIDQASRGITINTKVVLDGKEVGRSTTKEQQKRQVRNGRQKRGPNSAFR